MFFVQGRERERELCGNLRAEIRNRVPCMARAREREKQALRFHPCSHVYNAALDPQWNVEGRIEPHNISHMN